MMATMPGLILGTVAYMSPEQANGGEATRTSDMWAFGCVLYEMLTGVRAFDGTTTSEILANVLKTEPDAHRLPPETPERIRRLLRRCLQKDHKLRLRDMRDVRLEIGDVLGGPVEAARATEVRSRRPERLAWASALALLALIAGMLGVRALRPPPETREIRLDISTPPTRAASLSLSPDGSKVVFEGTSEGRSGLWLRSLDSQSMRPLPGTERGSHPFWSPDGRSIAFFADTKLKRVEISGGAPQALAPGGVPLGGAWNSDGTLLFANNPGGTILRLSAGSSEFTAATRLGSVQQRGHVFPRFLPDGRHFVFYANGSPEARGVYLGQLDDLNARRLFDADGPAVYSATGHLLFVRDGRLWAQGFDPDRLELKAEPFAVAEGATRRTALSVSAGTIAYRTPPPDSGQRQFVWVGRDGRPTDKVVYPDSAALGPSFSPDGRRIGVYKEKDGNMDIWSYETTRKTWDRITFDPGDDIYPLWSPDGASVAFGAVRGLDGIVNLYRKLLSSGPQGKEELLLTTPAQSHFPMDWSPNGRFLLYDRLDPKRGSDVWALPLDGDRKPFAIVETEFTESQGQFSPDGSSIAYQSDKTGRNEIYIRPFRGGGDDVQASIDGGTQPRWNPKGGELFYIGADDRLMAVPIRVSTVSKTIDPGVPRALFATNIGSAVTLAYRQQYLVSADGQSFVMNSAVTEGTASPISVILNWKP
jgi:Tol biopolymer transport system component